MGVNGKVLAGGTPLLCRTQNSRRGSETGQLGRTPQTEVGALLASIPVVVVNGLLTDYYIGGLVTGATKH